MKKILFACLLFVSTCSLAQDTIITRSNKVIVAAISEVSGNSVRYKQFSMPDGPDYIVDKSTLKKIVYKNGTVETIDQPQTQAQPEQQAPIVTNPRPKAPLYIPGTKFVPEGKLYTYNGNIVGESRMYKIMYQTKDEELKAIAKKAKKAKGLQFIGFGAIVAATYPIDILVLSRMPGFDDAYSKGEQVAIITAGSVAAVGLATTGLVFMVRHKKMKAKAVKLYNEKY